MALQHLLVQGDDILTFGVVARQTQRQIVGLRARVNEEAHGQWGRHLAGQGAGALHQLIVQEAIVRRDGGHLQGAGTHYLRMAVAHCKEREREREY